VIDHYTALGVPFARDTEEHSIPLIRRRAGVKNFLCKGPDGSAVFAGSIFISQQADQKRTVKCIHVVNADLVVIDGKSKRNKSPGIC